MLSPHVQHLCKAQYCSIVIGEEKSLEITSDSAVTLG